MCEMLVKCEVVPASGGKSAGACLPCWATIGYERWGGGKDLVASLFLSARQRDEMILFHSGPLGLWFLGLLVMWLGVARVGLACVGPSSYGRGTYLYYEE
jgi:hypothetical protein